MRIFHFELPKLGHGISGGEQCLIEVIRCLEARGIANVLVTTDNGRYTYEQAGLKEGATLSYAVIPSFAYESSHHPFLSYLHRTRLGIRLMATLAPQPGDVLLCNSDAFPNSIPFYRLAKRYPQTRLLYWYRMQAPPLWRGFKGAYTGRYYLPTPALIHYRLSQWLYRRLVLPRGIILTHNPFYRDLLSGYFPNHTVYQFSRYGGGLQRPTFPIDHPKTHDLVWMGRFHDQKGVWELIDIVKRLVPVKPDLSLLIIGGGSAKAIAVFNSACQRAGISERVQCVGEAHGQRKFDLLLGSRIFVMTSYYESYGIVITEAMSAGLPVVAYQLPVYGVFTKGIIKVPIGDNAAAAAVIRDLLIDPPAYARLAREAWEASREHTWDRVTDELLALCGDRTPIPLSTPSTTS